MDLKVWATPTEVFVTISRCARATNVLFHPRDRGRMGVGREGGGSRVGGLADALLGSFLRRRLPRPVNKADFNYTLCIYRLGVLFIFNVERDRRPGDCSNPFIPGFLIDIHAPFRLSEINRLCSSVAALYNLTAMKPSAPVSFSIVIKSLQGIFFFYRPVVEPRIN
jgi:hypothetical protein